jgi:hypothetical protein
MLAGLSGTQRELDTRRGVTGVDPEKFLCFFKWKNGY